jgi:hypothetical protein
LTTAAASTEASTTGPVLAARPHWSLGAQRAAALGMAASVVLHAILLTAFALITSQVGGGGSSSAAGPVDVAIITESELASLNEGDLTLETPGVEDVTQGIDLAPMPIEVAPGGDALKDIGDIGGNAGSGLGGAGTGTGIGVGDGSGGSGAGGTSFFGVAARGTRFAFIVDVSGSMNGDKIEILKRELAKSISKLGDEAQFVVVPFESQARPLRTGVRYLNASTRNRQEAIAVISELTAEGGTNPLPAFQLVLAMRPRPDAIYFMTDGQFDRTMPDSLRGLLAAGRMVTIHGICFVDNSSEDLMRQIAGLTKGTYTFVPGPQRGRP